MSEIDPTRFWVWVSNSELVPMLRKSQLPPIPRIRSPHSPAHSFALFPAYAHSFATLSRHERPACPPKHQKIPCRRPSIVSYCQPFHIDTRGHRTGSSQAISTPPALPCGRRTSWNSSCLDQIPRLLLDSPCSAPTLPPDGRDHAPSSPACRGQLHERSSRVTWWARDAAVGHPGAGLFACGACDRGGALSRGAVR